MWDFYPTGFFPRLLVRIMHAQFPVPASWANAAIFFSRSGDEVGLLQIKKADSKYCLEVAVVAVVLVTYLLILTGFCTF